MDFNTKTLYEFGYVNLVSYNGNEDDLLLDFTDHTMEECGKIGMFMPWSRIDVKIKTRIPQFVLQEFMKTELVQSEWKTTTALYVPDNDHLYPLSNNNSNAVRTALQGVLDHSSDAYSYMMGSKKFPDQINNRRLFVEESAMKSIRRAQQENPEDEWDDERINETIREWYLANDLYIVDSEFDGLKPEGRSDIFLSMSNYVEVTLRGTLKNLIESVIWLKKTSIHPETQIYATAMLDSTRDEFPKTHETVSRLI